MNKLFAGLGGTMVVVYLGLIVAAVYGYIENIVTLLHMIHDPITLLAILRIVGIFAFPLGAILGYF